MEQYEPQNPEVEVFEDLRVLPKDATNEQRIRDILERANERGGSLTDTEREEINALKPHADIDLLIAQAMKKRPSGAEEL